MRNKGRGNRGWLTRSVVLAVIISAGMVASAYVYVTYHTGQKHLQDVIASDTHSSLNFTWYGSQLGGNYITFGPSDAVTHFYTNGSSVNSTLSIELFGIFHPFATSPQSTTIFLFINGTISPSTVPTSVLLTVNDSGINTSPLGLNDEVYYSYENLPHSNVTLSTQDLSSNPGFTGPGYFSLPAGLTNQSSSKSNGTTYHFYYAEQLAMLQDVPTITTYNTLNFMVTLLGFADPVTCTTTLHITGDA